MAATEPPLRERRRGGYEQPRPEIQELVPLDARRILDIGCSSGVLGAALKERQGAEVIGIERDAAYAEDARRRLDAVSIGDAEELLTGPEAERLGSFDCLIAADVLEHLRDPWSALAAATRLLEPGASAVISVPNVRFWQTFFQLGLLGTWPLRDEGIFDRTHLRWFALRDAVDLLTQAGLRVSTVSPRYRLKPSDWRTERQGRWFAHTPLRAFFVFQYMLVGVKVTS